MCLPNCRCCSVGRFSYSRPVAVEKTKAGSVPRSNIRVEFAFNYGRQNTSGKSGEKKKVSPAEMERIRQQIMS